MLKLLSVQGTQWGQGRGVASWLCKLLTPLCLMLSDATLLKADVLLTHWAQIAGHGQEAADLLLRQAWSACCDLVLLQ